MSLSNLFTGKESPKGVHRIENISDAVFGLSITLLLVSTTVPTTFVELWNFTGQLLPFAACIGMVTWIWYEHGQFFNKFPINDRRIVILNTYLLILVLFYVYPLKFLFQFIFKYWYYTILWVSKLDDGSLLKEFLRDVISPYQIPWLMIIYGLGVVGVFGVFNQMYKYVFKRKEAFELGKALELECLRIKEIHKGVVVIALLSIGVSIIGLITKQYWFALPSGFVYAFIGFSIKKAWKRYHSQLKQIKTENQKNQS